MRKDTVKRISGNSDGPRMRAARRFPVTRRAESGVAATPERAVARLDDVARHDATDNHLAACTFGSQSKLLPLETQGIRCLVCDKHGL